MAVHGFRGLRVWQQGMRVSIAAIVLCRRMRGAEGAVLASQIRRACVSIPSNIAEGYGRDSRGDYLRFLSIANGSLRELETLVELGVGIGAVGGELAAGVLADCDNLGRMMSGMIRRLSATERTSRWRKPDGGWRMADGAVDSAAPLD
ncbi:MAG TPA: four helix bundle protein [Gemmatimonadaceae bacterium]|nr:four helix bundle protein [Gemmatimonadaceae bacterium]